MACNEALRLQAYFDGELDASAAAEIERHMEACRGCAALLGSLEAIRDGMRQETLNHRASPQVRSRVLTALDQETGNPWSIAGLLTAGELARHFVQMGLRVPR